MIDLNLTFAITSAQSDPHKFPGLMKIEMSQLINAGDAYTPEFTGTLIIPVRRTEINMIALNHFYEVRIRPRPHAKADTGFYWVTDRTGASIFIAEWKPDCGETGLWFFSGVSATAKWSELAIIDGPLLPPKANR